MHLNSVLGCDPVQQYKGSNQSHAIRNTKIFTLAEITQLSSSSAMDNSLQLMITNVLSSVNFHVFHFFVLDWGFLLTFLWLLELE